MRGCSTRVIICGVSPRGMASRLRISRFARSEYSRTEGHQVSVCQGFSSVSTTAEEEPECDISSLLEMLGTVPDSRSARGRIYRLSFILAVSLVAVLAGVSNFRQIRDQVADCRSRCCGSWAGDGAISGASSAGRVNAQSAG